MVVIVLEVFGGGGGGGGDGMPLLFAGSTMSVPAFARRLARTN